MNLPAPPAPGAGLRRTAAAALLAVVAGCDSGPPPPVPTTIELFPSTVTFDAVGATRSLTVEVQDQNGAAMDPDEVSWSSSDPAVVSVDAEGLLRSEGNGEAVVRASAGDVSVQTAVRVEQRPTRISKVTGDGQAAPAGTELPWAMEIQIEDRLGEPVADETIDFTVVAGGGSVDPESAVTDGQGRAATNWTLGPRAGETQVLQVAVAGRLVTPLTFEATGIPGPAVELRPVGGEGQAGLVGTALPVPLGVQVLDAFENALAAEVGFTVVSGGGSIDPPVVSSGLLGTATAIWTLGDVPGEQRARAAMGDLVFEFTATAAETAGPAATLEGVSGLAQEATAGSQLPEAVTVVVRDDQGIGVEGVEVTFSVAEGEVAPETSTTNASGLAATTWTLGPTIGPQELLVTVPGLPTFPVQVEALDPGPICDLGTADAGRFDITLCYVTEVSEAIESAFENARERWEEIIVGEASDIPPGDDWATRCAGAAAPTLRGPVVDDVVIFAVVEAIDGEFNVLGSAGPCFVRSSSNISIAGRMRFDVADLDRLADSGRLEDVIVHEMGHVLGIGTLWPRSGFLQNPVTAADTAGPVRPDTHFNGPLAVAAFDASGGQGRTSGQKVPVENASNSFGSLNGHWRETTMDRELMTPFLDAGFRNPLSVITVQSMADLGYEVDPGAADSYTVPSPNAVSGLDRGEEIHLVDDILRMPLRIVDDEGRVVRIVRPDDLPPGGR